jgi:cell division protein FtsL
MGTGVCYCRITISNISSSWKERIEKNKTEKVVNMEIITTIISLAIAYLNLQPQKYSEETKWSR